MLGTQVMPTLLDLAAGWVVRPSAEMGKVEEHSLGCGRDLVLREEDRRRVGCGS